MCSPPAIGYVLKHMMKSNYEEFIDNLFVALNNSSIKEPIMKDTLKYRLQVRAINKIWTDFETTDEIIKILTDDEKEKMRIEDEYNEILEKRDYEEFLRQFFYEENKNIFNIIVKKTGITNKEDYITILIEGIKNK